jgi:hypothetical protein
MVTNKIIMSILFKIDIMDRCIWWWEFKIGINNRNSTKNIRRIRCLKKFIGDGLIGE